MTTRRAPAAKASWDGQRVLFEVSHDGRAVPCAISPAVLSELSSRRCFEPADALSCFEAARGEVEAIARAKLARRVGQPPIPLSVWTTDVEAYSAAAGGGT